MNPHIEQRLRGIATSLMGVYEANSNLSSATKGVEREGFVRLFLDQLFPTLYRFGDGDITDSHGNRSGQCDIVVEYPFLPSIPMPGGGSRLYLADGVGAVIEVKSNLKNQWDQAIATSDAVAMLERNTQAVMTMGDAPGPRIPVFAVGYTGWSNLETLVSHVEACSIDVALIIDTGLLAINSEYFPPTRASGCFGMWLFISALHDCLSQLKAAHPSLLPYVQKDEQAVADAGSDSTT